MAVKEGKDKQLGRALDEMVRLPVLMGAAENLIRFLLAAILAGAEVFGGCSMGGVAITAVSGAGTAGLSALLGACFGYLCFQGLVEGLRYIAACVLVYALSFAFWDLYFYRLAWFMPLSAALLNGLVGFIYLSEAGWSSAQVIYFITELALTAALTYFCRLAFSVWDEPREEGLTVRQMVGVLTLGCAVLVTLEKVTLMDVLSLGRILSALCAILAAWKGGIGMGAVAGVAAGLAMDFAAADSPYFVMAYAFSGLMAGVFFKQGRLMTAVAYVTANTAAVLWTWPSGPRVELFYEVLAAGITFLLLPERLFRRLSLLARPVSVTDAARRAREHTVRRLSAAATAFRELSDELQEAVTAAAPVRTSASAIFDRAADRVCLKCSLRELCWTRDYQSTRSALNDALPLLLDKGRGSAAEYPPWFTAKCVEFKSFSAAVNEELSAHLARRQYQARARENRGAVCRQYAQLAGVLESACAELSREPAPDPVRQRRLQQRLTALGLEGESAVYYDENGRLRVEIAGTRLTVFDSEAERERLSDLMGTPLRKEESEEKDTLRLVQSEPFMAVVGVAAKEKDGQNVSGDAGAWFKDDNGNLHIFLCDGMGSGQSARADSTLALDLLEKFLKAGVSPHEALRTLNDSLALRGEEKGGFTTIDLLRLDLFTGQGTLYKLGAAPTFLRRGNKVVRLTGQSLPAGLTMQGGGGVPDTLPLKLAAGDWLVMASDGVTGTDDSWIVEALAGWEGDSPRLLARDLLEGAAARHTPGDDRTVVALRLAERS